jgi:hypothetical protein
MLKAELNLDDVVNVIFAIPPFSYTCRVTILVCVLTTGIQFVVITDPWEDGGRVFCDVYRVIGETGRN